MPEFKEWHAQLLATTIKAPDGKTKHRVVEEVLRRLRAPTADSGEAQARPRMLEIIKAQAERCLEKMHDKKIALADKLESQGGLNSLSNNADAHKRTQGAHGTNDAVENKFATADFVMRTFRRISVVNASGVVQQRTAHDFDRPLTVVSDRRKRKATAPEPEKQEAGFFWRVLNSTLRDSLVEMARREAPAARQAAAKDKLSHNHEKLARREEALTRQLNAAVDKYAEALELYDQWKSQGVRDKAQLTKALRGLSINDQLAELRRQIEMRSRGCGWTHFAVKLSYNSDEKEATIKLWKAQLLDEIIPYEMQLRRLKQLPAAAAPPQLKPRLTKTLGTADADALRLEAASLFNVDRLLERAQAERARREAAGISDSAEATQPLEAPAFDTNLVGKRLEVCWPYKKDGTTVKIWASGTVRRVADGLTDKRSERAKKILPAGALLWAWEADPEFDESAGEQWLVLLPEKWNRQVQYAWRFDPCELAPAGVPRSSPRRPHVERSDEEDDFLDWEEHVESMDCDDE